MNHIRTLLLTAIAALALVAPAYAQSTLTSSTISTAGADCSVATRCADFDTGGVPAFALYLNVGTSGTFNWEGSVDATTLTSGTWFSVTDDVDGTSSATADGVKYFTTSGYRRFRVRASAISGDATVVAFRGVLGARASVASIAAGNNNIGDVDAVQSGTWTVQPGNTANTTAWLITDAGVSNSFAAQSAVGQTTALVPVSLPKDHSIQLVVTGGPAACTYRLQGSNDAGTTWFDISGADITCTASTVAFETGKPADRIRGDLKTLSGGTSPTVTLHYAGR